MLSQFRFEIGVTLRTLILPVVLCFIYFARCPLYAQTPAHFSLQVDDGRQEELAGVPIRNPALVAGSVQNGPAFGQLHLQTPDLPASFGSLLVGSGPCYLEFVGPPNHPWIGHRLEVDVAKTKQSTNSLVFLFSSHRNTKWPINSTVDGAQAEIRTHIVLPKLLNRVLKNEAIQSFGLYPAPAFANLAINLNPGHISSLYVWLDLAGKVLWGTNPSTDSSMAEDSIVLPPGSAFALKQGPTPFGIGFSGDEVKTPVLAPIYAGTNLLCYPYLAPLKLSPEWSAKNKFESKTKSRSSYDIIAVKKNGKDEKYALYPWFGFGSYGVWQKIDPINGSWSQPPRYLKMISPGEGFYFITSKNYPSHTFSTP